MGQGKKKEERNEVIIISKLKKFLRSQSVLSPEDSKPSSGFLGHLILAEKIFICLK